MGVFVVLGVGQAFGWAGFGAKTAIAAQGGVDGELLEIQFDGHSSICFDGGGVLFPSGGGDVDAVHGADVGALEARDAVVRIVEESGAGVVGEGFPHFRILDGDGFDRQDVADGDAHSLGDGAHRCPNILQPTPEGQRGFFSSDKRVLYSLCFHRSTSPKTISILPIVATKSAIIWPGAI